MARKPDRRNAARRRSVAEHGVVSVRVRPAIDARLVDLSPGGARIDTAHRLVPGRYVHVQMVFPSGTTTVRGRVLRSEVTRLAADGVGYRCAVGFDRPVRWAVQENGVRYVVVE
ncbi:MAG: PilZ domain-containing protein [Vicinamibacterales bacterium]